MSFDWQTEDRHWEELDSPRRATNAWASDLPAADDLLAAPEPVVVSPVAQRPRRWPFLLAVGALVAALLAVLYWQLDRRVAATETRLTTEVLSSHEMILEAAQAADGELFVTFLSGRDRNWAVAQERLARAGGFADRSAFALTWLPGTPLSPTVTLAADLNAAELTAPLRYSLDIGNGLTETVTLEQTVVFRQGPDRWLFSPPDDGFWGETAAVEYRYLFMTYPTRDADVAEPLARDIDTAMAQFCREVDELCARLHLVLTTNPASLNAYDRPESTWTGGSEIVMPTPTLFGRPLDDAGYRALYRAYAARVVAAAAANASGWQCCDDALFYGALLDARLHQLGLRPWPVGANEYSRLARQPELLRDVEGLWRRDTATADERLLAYTLVDFLVTRSNLPVPYIQRILLNDIDMSYWAWITRATSGLYGSQEDFERDLLRHAAERGLDATAMN